MVRLQGSLRGMSKRKSVETGRVRRDVEEDDSLMTRQLNNNTLRTTVLVYVVCAFYLEFQQ